ncbi:EthD domain-containing protein [Streptomyces spongiae]|uniref:EthD family reductase n=1 Tax=Streptomyces spongiae TaxID=565072 RepID=A0A5N8XRC0_9ACTN|nr:EthD domain-containing protein [Streptomyces spongiae]MPY61716.1 EthD family reductase [Streptomyces spongiae]
MIKLVAAIRRRPDMTHSEYADYIRDVHGGLALAKKLTLRKYVQNHVFDSAYGATGDIEYQVTWPRDSVTELYYDDVESMMRGFEDPHSAVVAADGANFSDMPSAVSLLVEEHRPEVPNPGPGAVKVLLFMEAAEGVTPQEFRGRWRQAHDDVLADASGPAGTLRGYQWNTAVAGDARGEHFGSSGQPSYEAYAALWFDEAEALPAFRAYHTALTAHAEKRGPFHQPSRSFFLLSREVVIFDDLTGNTSGPKEHA